MSDINKKPPAVAGTEIFIRIFRALLVIAVAGAIAFFVYGNTFREGVQFPFRF